MLFSLIPSDLEICARTLALLDDNQSEQVRSSLAWLIRNRLIYTAALSAEPPGVAKICTQIFKEATGRLGCRTPQAMFPNTDWCRFYAVTCQVWAGDLADETGGATFCHRHDRAPLWARKRSPTALIGPYLFFR